MQTLVDYLQSRLGQDTSESPSPVGRGLKAVLRAAEKGAITVDFTVQTEHTNPMGLLHGGVTATLIDEAMGIAISTLEMPAFYATVSLDVHYLEGARAGEVVTCTARVVRQGKTLIHAEAEVHLADGRLMARASSNLVSTAR